MNKWIRKAFKKQTIEKRYWAFKGSNQKDNSFLLYQKKIFSFFFNKTLSMVLKINWHQNSYISCLTGKLFIERINQYKTKKKKIFLVLSCSVFFQKNIYINVIIMIEIHKGFFKNILIQYGNIKDINKEKYHFFLLEFYCILIFLQSRINSFLFKIYMRSYKYTYNRILLMFRVFFIFIMKC